MSIVVASLSPHKLAAVTSVAKELLSGYPVIGINASSDINAQPVGLEGIFFHVDILYFVFTKIVETLLGAKNRIRNSKKELKDKYL